MKSSVKDVTNNNITNHKSGLLHLPENYTFEKTTCGSKLTPSSFRVKETLRNQGDKPDFCKFWQTSGRSLISSMPIKRYILKLLYLATGFKMSLRDK